MAEEATPNNGESVAPKPAPRPRNWRSGGPARRFGEDPPDSGKGKKVFYALLGISSILAAIGGLLYWIRPYEQPFLQSMAVTEYKEKRFPANAFGQQDSDALVALFPEKSQKTRAYDSQERDRFVEELKALPGRAKAAGVVLHLSALARAEGTDVRALPADAQADQRDLDVSLKEVFLYLSRCKTPNKLLILDVARPIADARLGILANDLATRTREACLTALKEDPNLQILLPCLPGQMPLVSVDLGQSVFGYYVAEGLRGGADRSNPRREANDRVTVQELFLFVQARVDRWARAHGEGMRQTPELLGTGPDFEVLGLDHNREKRPQRTAVAAPTAYLPALIVGWTMRDEWLDAGADRYAPRAVRQLEAALLRAERRWEGGFEAARVTEQLGDEVRELKAEVERARGNVKEPRALYSLALAGGGTKPDEKLIDALRTQFTKLEDDKDAVKEEVLNRYRDQFLEAQKLKDQPGAVRDVVRAGLTLLAEDTNLSPPKVWFLFKAAQRFLPKPGASGQQYAEAVFLQRLVEQPSMKPGVPVAVNDEHAAKIKVAMRQALQLMALAERCLAHDPRALAWVRTKPPGRAADAASLLDRALDERTRAELRLFADAFEKQSRSEDLIADQEAAMKTYGQVEGVCDAVAEAHRALDRAFVELPGMVPYFLEYRSDKRELEAWTKAVDLAAGLHEALVLPLTGLREDDLRGRLGGLREGGAQLRTLLNELRQPIAPESLTRAEKDLAELDALLASPLLRGTQPSADPKKPPRLWREVVWELRRKEAARRTAEVLAQDEGDDDPLSGKTTPLGPSWEPRRALDEERKLAERRARLAVELLRLGGLTEARPLEEKRRAALSAGAAEVDEYGELLRKAWVRLPEQHDLFVRENGLVAADRLSRVLYPFDLVRGGGRQGGAPEPPPASQLRRREAEAHWRWLGTRYLAEARGDGSTEPPGYWKLFYDQAGRDYLAAGR